MSESRPIVGILLAAGRGTRFGGGKLLAPLPVASHGVAAGTTIGAAAALHLCAAVSDVVAVIRLGDAALREALSATGAHVIECPRADEGMGASLACGVTAVSDARGFVVALADMPWIAPATIEKVVQALVDGAAIAAPFHAGQRGHPVGFAATYAAELRALSGDEGARPLLARYARAVHRIDVDDAAVARDVDAPADLRA